MLFNLCKLIDWNPPKSDQKLCNQSFTVTADASPALRLTSTAVDSPAAWLQQVRRGERGELCEGKPIWKQSLTINHSDWFDYSVPDATGRTVLYDSSTENTSCLIPSPSKSDTTEGNSPKQQPHRKTEFTTAINQKLQPSIG